MHANGRFEVMKIVDVETQRLDAVLSKLGNPEIGLLKMDAEGAEFRFSAEPRRCYQQRKNPS